MDLAITTGAFAIAMGGIKIAEMAIARLTNGKNGRLNSFGPSQAQQLHDLHDWHDQTDGDGRKIWYIPRDIMKLQVNLLRDILEELRKRPHV